MSKTLTTLDIDQLSAVSGGAAEDPFAPVGSPGRCAFLKSEMDSRSKLIANDAVRGTIGGDRGALTPRIYGNGAILSRDQFEFRQRCRR
jgi:hypothetical protein